jgi:hypothetical protein
MLMLNEFYFMGVKQRQGRFGKNCNLMKVGA